MAVSKNWCSDGPYGLVGYDQKSHGQILISLIALFKLNDIEEQEIYLWACHVYYTLYKYKFSVMIKSHRVKFLATLVALHFTPVSE